MIEPRDETKIRKFKPVGQRDENFNELTDLNLWHQHEISKAGYTYEDALGVFVNRLYNYKTVGNAETNGAILAARKELEEAVASGDGKRIESCELYKKAKTQLDNLLNIPGVDELIPKKYWDAFSNFYGINSDALHHPPFLFGV